MSDVRTIPAYLSATSLLLLGLHSFISKTRLRRLYSLIVDVSYSVKELRDPVYQEPIAWSILQSFRLLACLSLLSTQIILAYNAKTTLNIIHVAFFVCISSTLRGASHHSSACSGLYIPSFSHSSFPHAKMEIPSLLAPFLPALLRFVHLHLS